jgi:hypothetical protein
LLFLNRLNQAEKDFNEALKPLMDKATNAVDDVIRTMEASSERLRRESEEHIFA